MRSEFYHMKIDDICSKVCSGGTPDRKHNEYYENGTIPWLNTGEINFNRIRKTNKYITELGYKSSSAKWIPSNSIIVAMYGSTAGKVAISEIELTTNQACCNLIVDVNKADFRYVYYFLKFKYTHLASLANGGAQQNLNAGQIKNFDIEIPDLETQKVISNILSVLDDKIDENNHINQNLLEQATALFEETLGHSKTISNVKLGDIASIKGGKRLPKGVSLITVPNSHPYIRIRDLNNVIYASLDSNYEYVDDNTYETISRYIVSSGDILISIVGTIGLIAIVDKTLNFANLTENCVKLTNLKQVPPEYVFLFLRSKQGQDAILKGTVGAVQLKLPIKNIQSIDIPLPNEQELQKLVGVLSVLFAKISNNVIESQKLSLLRDNLLPYLMSGDLDVSGLDF